MATTYTFTQDECPCRELPAEPCKTNHEDEAIVFDVITKVAHRCRLCGRRFTVEMVPGDFTLGGHPDKMISHGHDGHPLLSVAAAKARLERRSHIAATVPEHESEGQALTEASQTDE